jgi:hypothetical protein
MLDQLDPTVVLRNFQKIAKASSALLTTSIPASEVDRFIGLALKAKDQKVSTLSIVPPVFDTYEPNAELIQQKVAEAIDTSEGNAPKQEPASGGDASTKKPKGPKGPKATQATQATQPEVTGGSIGSLHDGYAANESQDLNSAC